MDNAKTNGNDWLSEYEAIRSLLYTPRALTAELRSTTESARPHSRYAQVGMDHSTRVQWSKHYVHTRTGSASLCTAYTVIRYVNTMTI